MSDSEDDAASAAATAQPRQKSIFSTMGRVRNMNHLREKWTARAKLSSSSSSDLEASVSSAIAAAGGIAPLKKQTVTSVSQLVDVASTSTAATNVTAAVAAMTPLEAQRFAVLSTWMQRSGLVVPPTSGGDAFDTLFATLEEMEAAVKRELSLLLPPQWPQSTPPRSTSSASPLVDYMVVIGPDVTDLATQSFWLGQQNVFEATVVFAHPPHTQFNAESIEQFCFPRGVRTGSEHELDAADEFFVLVLSGGGDQGQSVQYACCLRKQIVVTGLARECKVVLTQLVPVCYAVVVSIPWIPFYRQLLRHLAARHQENLWTLSGDNVQSTIVPDTLAQHIDSMMTMIATTEVPARGHELRFSWAPIGTFTCVRPRADCGTPETVILLLDWAMRHLLSVLSVESVIKLIGLLLVEMKLIVVSTSMPLLSAGTVGLAALLNPLSWAGPLISILPPALHEYLEAPVPLLCGVDILPEQFVATKGTAILMMDKDEIRLHPDDAAQAGALQFPGSEGLSRQLRAFSDRILSMPSREQSHIVISNFVVRRIRRQLLDLLQLCSRVNPCNAYACMKQEQLSLSETLFLKSFMQSQMYQKYSDDQSPEDASTSNEKCDPSKGDDMARAETPRQLDATVPSLSSSIRDLFLLAITGACSAEVSPSFSSPRRSLVPTEPVFEATSESLSKEVYPEVLTVKSRRSSYSSSKSNSPLESLRPVSERQESSSDTEGNQEIEDALNPSQNRSSRVDPSVLPLIPGDHELSFSSSVHSCLELTVGGGEAKSQSTPTSPDKPSDALAPHHKDHRQTNATRSMPDVLITFEAQNTFVSGVEDESVFYTESEIEVTDSHTQLYSCVHSRSSRQPDVFTCLSHSIAATRIQATWRKFRLVQRTPKRTDSSRALSVASARSASDTTVISSTAEWTRAELHFGTMLSTRTDRGKAIDVRMRLGPDGTDLQWSQGDKQLGVVALKDVQEVKARDGSIVIQTSTGQYIFTVPTNGASGVMGFFQALHRLATNDSSGLPSPATSNGSSDHNSRTPIVSRQESGRSGGFESVLKVARMSESREMTLDKELTAASFLSFDDAMRRGILVLKHGRMGRPHPKYLISDDSVQVLSWVDPTVTNAGFQPPPSTLQPIGRAEKKGVRFDDITNVLRGKHTRVLQRSTAGRSNSELCFSIVTRGRTLDIEAFSREDLMLLVDGIQQRVIARRAVQR